MEQNIRLRREICRIVIAMSAGEASEQQHVRLEDLIRDNPWARSCVVDALTQMSDLEWEGRETSPALKALIDAAANVPSVGTSAAGARPRPQRSESRLQGIALWRSWGSVAGAFSLGAAAALIFMLRLGFERPGDVFVVDSIPTQPSTAAVARLVSNTSHMIDAEMGRALKTGDAIHAGKSVTLFEGVAEVQFDNAVSMRVKGPALLSIDGAGVAQLKYGRLIVTNHGTRPFALQLPLGTTSIAENSYVGIDGHGDDVFIYTFEGEVQVTPENKSGAEIVRASAGLRVRRGARTEIVVTWLQADSKTFDFDLLMASDQINVTQKYVDAITNGKPVAYWRFENEGADVVRNEMGSNHQLGIEGDGVRIVPRDGNGVAEFVIRDAAACLASHEPFDEVAGGDYSVEMWVKPSHFHWGTLAALMERGVDADGEVARHAMIVELHGANAPPEGRAKSIRFLHRSPPSDQSGGTSCFSSAFYRAQMWQHVAAVKRGDQLNLYLNGELVASATDATILPNGLQLVVGQLFSFGTVRPFVGHIDELAVYDRALSLEEIRQHIETMRDEQGDKSSARAAQGSEN